MLQVSIANVSFVVQTYVASVFIWMLHIFDTYVASVLSGYCICFSMAFQVFSGIVVSVLDACFKCFICLQTYVINVLSGCFQNRSGVAAGTRRSRRPSGGSRGGGAVSM